MNPSDAVVAPASPPKLPKTARDRELRKLRIFAWMEEGWSYEAIGREERLSRERVRQIVSKTLEHRDVDPVRDHKLLQIARLAPALRLAGQAIAAGEIGAIDKLVRVLDRLDKYQNVAMSVQGGEDARERLLRKLDNMARNHQANAKIVEEAKLAYERGKSGVASPETAPVSGPQNWIPRDSASGGW